LSLSQLRYAKGSIRHRRRLGAGTGSGRGGTCGRGTKGQKSRSGGKAHPWFEGGQMPLQRRLPKRGFKKRNPLVYQVVNLKDLERVDPGSVVDAAALAERGLIRDPGKPVKVLGDGDVREAYAVKVSAASKSAVRKIEAAGGSVEISAGEGRSAGKAKPRAGGEADKKTASAVEKDRGSAEKGGEPAAGKRAPDEKPAAAVENPAGGENPETGDSPAEKSPEKKSPAADGPERQDQG